MNRYQEFLNSLSEEQLLFWLAGNTAAQWYLDGVNAVIIIAWAEAFNPCLGDSAPLKEILESFEAVNKGDACWLSSAPEMLPMLEPVEPVEYWAGDIAF